MERMLISKRWQRQLIFIIFIGAIGILFWRDIAFTTLYLYTVTTSELVQYQEYSLNPKIPPSSRVITHGEIHFSVPFEITDSKVGDFYGVYSGNDSRSLILFKNSPTPMTNQFQTYNNTYAGTVCDIFQKGLSKNICTSEYEFSKAILSLNIVPIGINSSQESKLTYTIIANLQKVLINESTVLAYDESNAKGFIITADNTADQAIIYDSKDIAHILSFYGLSQGERDYILS